MQVDQPTLQESDQTSVHGRRLRVYIGERLVNVSALARKLDMDQGNLSRFLSGKRPYTPSFARRVASELGISVDTLLDAIDSRR